MDSTSVKDDNSETAAHGNTPRAPSKHQQKAARKAERVFPNNLTLLAMQLFFQWLPRCFGAFLVKVFIAFDRSLQHLESYARSFSHTFALSLFRFVGWYLSARICLHSTARSYLSPILQSSFLLAYMRTYFCSLDLLSTCMRASVQQFVQSYYSSEFVLRISMCDSSLSRRWYLSHIRSQEGEIMCSVCPSEKSLLDKYWPANPSELFNRQCHPTFEQLARTPVGAAMFLNLLYFALAILSVHWLFCLFVGSAIQILSY